MSSPTERTPAKVETLLGGLDMETLMAFADNDIESIYETLQEPFEDMERKIVVSSMVQEAVAKGFLKALEEESCTQLACKDREIDHLKDRLKEKDASIADLQKVLGIREDDVSVADSSDRSRYQHLWDFMQESQKKWRESEASVHEKERELERLASSMAHMASILDNENKRAALLNKQLNDLKEQETIKTGQISSLQQEINKLKNDNSRLKRQARLKVLQFDESMEQTQGELQQQRLELERLAQEREGLEKALEDKNKAFSDLENGYRASESKVSSMDEKVKSLLMVESTLQEIIEGQKLMQEGERDVLMTYMEQQMIKIHSELGQFLDGSQFSHPQQAVRQWQLSSWDAGDPSEAKSADDMKELTWKADAEGVLVQVVMEGWYKEVTEVLHKLTFELGWKDEGIFYRDRELRSLKQAVEELENDYATLMSICLTLIRDQNDNDTKEEPTGLSVHELGRRKLLELSEFLNSREVSGGQEEKSTPELELEEELAAEQLQHELKLEIVSEVFKQDVPSEFLNSREVSGGQEGKSSPELELEEELAGQELQHELVLEIVSEVFIQKYQEALYMVLDLKFTSLCDYGTVETVEKKVCNNFEELEAQLESFLELEACRLERIRSGCSTSIAKCEFKLENLMKSLADQVNEMKTKISFVQEAIKQQEWKHMVEEDILVLVLWDALAEMYRKLNSEELPQQIRNVQLRLSNSSNDSVNSLDGMDTSVSPKKGGDYHPKSENESQRLKCSKILETRLGIQDKDKLILSLKRDIEGLRKEKAVIEQNLDERTEELYSLKRQFWKEKEIWVSKLSQPQRKEVEVQVEALSRHSSASLDLEELRKLEMVRFDSLISELRKEWLLEKEGLLHNISQKEVQGEKMAAELARLREKEKSSNSTEAGLLARIADLKIQADNLSSERLNQDFHFAKYRQEWQTEKESMRGELDKLLEKESGHVVSAGRLLARIAELEIEMESLRLARLDQGSSFLKLKQEWQTERERLLERVSEREDTMSKLAALSEKEKSNAKLIEQLETERDRLITGWRYKEPSATSLMEEKEIALALAIKEKEEEEKKRKFLEIQLQGLRLEVKNLQGLNDKVAHLKGKLESVPRQLELKFAEQIGHSVKASQEFEQRVIHMMQEKSVSLDGIKEKCRFLKGHFKSFATREALYKQRLAKELNNLQKAETEVDLLGDEVESLLDILEKVQVAFDLYAPVLQHYPRMTEVAKFVKQEIQLRIDPKYGA